MDTIHDHIVNDKIIEDRPFSAAAPCLDADAAVRPVENALADADIFNAGSRLAAQRDTSMTAHQVAVPDLDPGRPPEMIPAHIIFSALDGDAVIPDGNLGPDEKDIGAALRIETVRVRRIVRIEDPDIHHAQTVAVIRMDCSAN